MKAIEHGDNYMFHCKCGCVYVAKQRECLHIDEDARTACSLCPECGEMVTEIQEEDSFFMNARQSLKLASQRVAELERILALNKSDIINYNLCILSMIDGKSPCGFCEDQEECKLEAKDGKGCGEWMLKMHKFTQETVNEEGDNASEGVHASGSESRE